MVNLFRRYRQPLMIVLTILIILAFGVFYNPTQNQAEIQIATINGRPVTFGERQHSEHRFELMRGLGMFEVLTALVGNVRSQSPDAYKEAFLWNTMVLRHEAEQLGIVSAKPDKAEQERLAPLIADRIQALPGLQTNGVFDLQKFNSLTQGGGLGSLGLTPNDLEEMMVDVVRVDKVKEVLAGTVAPTPGELREMFRQGSQKLEASVIRLNFDDFKKAAQVTDDEVKKAFEERKASFATPEKRKVKFVGFTLAQQKTQLMGPERFNAIQELIKEAQDFSVAMTKEGANFDQTAQQFRDRIAPKKPEPKPEAPKNDAAKPDAPKDDAAKAAEAKPDAPKADAEPANKYEVTTGETGFFSGTEPPKELAGAPAAADAAFKLTKEQPTSDVVRTANGAYVLQLLGTEESRPQTFEEVKEKLTETLREEKGREAMSVKANGIRKQIEAEIKAGKPFLAAAEAAGTKPEKVPAFSPREPLRDVPDAQFIQGLASQLSIGEISQYTPTQKGGMLVHVDRQLPLDESEFAKQKESLAERATESNASAIFIEWLSARRKAASIQGAREG